MATLSLCMIVKNEEAVLSRCLESIKDAVDEIIIVDTGSSDATKEIAKKYTDLVYDFKWINNFSAARNFSFSKASKDYIIWLDADDVITEENKTKILDLKNNLSDEDIVMLKYNTAFDENGNAIFSYYRERIINRKSRLVWKGRVHEAIECTGKIIYSDISVNHHSVKTEYSTRNLDIYEHQIADGEPMQPRDTFYYGRELYYHRKYERAIKTLSEFLENKNGWIENNIEACKILSFCYSETNRTDNALKALFSSFTYDSPRAETCCQIGNLFIKQNKYENAIFWFELALTIPKQEAKGAFVDLDSYGYLPCIQLCVCYDKIKQYAKAEEYNLKAGAYRPSSEAYLQNLKYFESLHKNNITE